MHVARMGAVLVALACSAMAVAQADGIAWLHAYDEALQQARQNSKLVMVNFYTDW